MSLKKTLPAEGVSRPAKICKRVVFPHPDDPIIPMDLPSPRTNEISAKTSTECWALVKLIEIFLA